MELRNAVAWNGKELIRIHLLRPDADYTYWQSRFDTDWYSSESFPVCLWTGKYDCSGNEINDNFVVQVRDLGWGTIGQVYWNSEDCQWAVRYRVSKAELPRSIPLYKISHTCLILGHIWNCEDLVD